MVTNIPKARHALFDDLNDRLTTRLMHVDKYEFIGGDHLTHSFPCRWYSDDIIRFIDLQAV